MGMSWNHRLGLRYDHDRGLLAEITASARRYDQCRPWVVIVSATVADLAVSSRAPTVCYVIRRNGTGVDHTGIDVPPLEASIYI